MRAALLASTTALLIYILLQGGLTELLRQPDGVHPRPLVELTVSCGGEIQTVEPGDVVECGDPPIKIHLKLINNSGEPSLDDLLASGVMMLVRNGYVLEVKLGDFLEVIGLNEDAEIIDHIGASIIEVFGGRIGPWEAKEMEATIEPRRDLEEITIEYRAWIIDEDDTATNPTTGEQENYVARYPPEHPTMNPPDSRWAGKEFLKYKTAQITISPKIT